MSDAPEITYPELGAFRRARTELLDGGVLDHDWYSTLVEIDGESVELTASSGAPEEVRAMLPRIAETVRALPTLRRVLSDAVVTSFSEGEPTAAELDDAASDLELQTIEGHPDGSVTVHLNDGCGEHFPEGSWPAVHLDRDGAVTDVTVEA
ncbi:hypothetical protein [Agromyces soli]|uniref:DUF2004 domain-containing protein n=1 Tax=Agromyces soli TaxID=659012 RepID=A0ABY4AWH3_9MICO|nr:hypothetical protein [Agromyces soli]UOE27350.1 hypothetical protein MTP13_06090 [Agromyces soli]